VAITFLSFTHPISVSVFPLYDFCGKETGSFKDASAFWLASGYVASKFARNELIRAAEIRSESSLVWMADGGILSSLVPPYPSSFVWRLIHPTFALILPAVDDDDGWPRLRH